VNVVNGVVGGCDEVPSWMTLIRRAIGSVASHHEVRDLLWRSPGEVLCCLWSSSSSASRMLWRKQQLHVIS
jgi:hypothetical protein